MEEFVNGKNHTIITERQATDIGMRIPVTFTINGEKFVSTLNGRIEPENTHKVKE